MIICAKCGQEKEEHKKHKGVCVDCGKALDNRSNYLMMRNDDWMKIAEENDIPLYDRQPEENITEHNVWLAYRDMYPNERPNLRVVAERTGLSYGHVKRVSARWDFPVRLQAWIASCDEKVKQQRQNAIVDMNKKHISMAARLQDKISQAIDNIDPMTLAPNELNNLMKTATELERKAYGDATEVYKPVVSAAGNKDAKDSPTEVKDLPEVLGILSAAGIISNGKKSVGIETTQRVIIKEDEE